MRHSQGFVPWCTAAKLWRVSCFLIFQIATPIIIVKDNEAWRSRRKPHAKSEPGQDYTARRTGIATARTGLQQQGDRGATQHQPQNGEATSPDSVPAGWNKRWKKTGQVGDRDVRKGADEIMQPRERLTIKEMQVAALVWEGQTNREIARAIGTTEQVVKNYLRNTFDKLGVWSRLELAIYVARHGGERSRNEIAVQPVDVLSGVVAS
jgi:DNA-binding CsgD family transcriptional regulator